jgi:hypothetical protein
MQDPNNFYLRRHQAGRERLAQATRKLALIRGIEHHAWWAGWIRGLWLGIIVGIIFMHIFSK